MVTVALASPSVANCSSTGEFFGPASKMIPESITPLSLVTHQGWDSVLRDQSRETDAEYDCVGTRDNNASVQAINAWGKDEVLAER
jgi:hypothetical protein